MNYTSFKQLYHNRTPAVAKAYRCMMKVMCILLIKSALFYGMFFCAIAHT